MSLIFQNIDNVRGTHLPGGEGGGGSIVWKTRDIGLSSYSKNLSTERGLDEKKYSKNSGSSHQTSKIFAHAQTTSNQFWRMLNIRRNDKPISKPSFKISWAHAERISSLADQTQKPFYRWLSQRGNDFSAHSANTKMFELRIYPPNRLRFSKI